MDKVVCKYLGLNAKFKIQILNGLKPSFLRFRWLKWKSLSFLSSFCSIPEIVKSLMMSSNKNYHRNLFFSIKSQRSLYNWHDLTNLLAQKISSFCLHRTIKLVKWQWLWSNGGLFTNFIGVQIARNRLCKELLRKRKQHLILEKSTLWSQSVMSSNKTKKSCSIISMAISGFFVQRNQSELLDISTFLYFKVMFSKKATKNDKNLLLTLCSKCQIYGEDFVNFRKFEHYNIY